MLLNDKYWANYILVKHVCEIVVLTLELIISTAIKSYDARGAGPPATAAVGGSGGGGSNSSARAVSYASVGGRGPASSAAAAAGGRASYGATEMVGSASEHSEQGVSETTPMLAQRPYVRTGPNDV